MKGKWFVISDLDFNVTFSLRRYEYHLFKEIHVYNQYLFKEIGIVIINPSTLFIT